MSRSKEAAASAAHEPIPLLCLGSGAALTDGHGWSSLLIDGRILLDIPPTAVPAFHKAGVETTAIDVIFISHMHADHLFGLPFLLLEYCVRCERSERLFIIGPPGLEETMDKLCSLAWPDMEKAGFQPRVPITYIEAVGDAPVDVLDLHYVAVPMNHFGLSAFGYRLEYKGRTIGYTGDTGESDRLDDLLAGCDLAILEATHPRPAEDPGHLDVDQVTALAQQLTRNGTAVYATHMSARPSGLANVTLCEDGQTYWV